MIDTYKAFDQRKSGWVKAEFLPGEESNKNPHIQTQQSQVKV